ncbi:MAG: hypothetical protein HUK01_03620 [Bacteroidaceae bacterium]|nr:hypothetical protein [Bacteroidaceae bacterium]
MNDIRLFNALDNGAQEIIKVLGLIDADVDWSKWSPILPLGMRKLIECVGNDVVDKIDELYRNDDGEAAEIVRLAQQSVAMFTWLRIIPTLEAQHGTAGRGKHLGENEKGLSAVQEFKDEDNIRHMAYEAMDELVYALEAMGAEWWTASEANKRRKGLLIRDKETFDLYYSLGSHRLFVTLLPIIREVQSASIEPIVGKELMKELLGGAEGMEQLNEAACRPLALLTMKKAVERLPVEVLPEGIVQVQQSGMVKDKLKAEQSARQSVANNLGADAAMLTQRLQDIVALMTHEEAEVLADLYLSKPLPQSKGITF